MSYEERLAQLQRDKAAAELADSPLMAHARTTDPETSHDAAASIRSERIRASQVAVLDTFRQHGPLTQEELVTRYARAPMQSDSGLRTRASELVALGKLVDTGKRRKLKSGRKAIIWRAA